MPFTLALVLLSNYFIFLSILNPAGSNTSRQNLRTISVPGQGSVVEGPHHETSTRGKVRITGEIRRPEFVLFDDPVSKDSQVLVLKVGVI